MPLADLFQLHDPALEETFKKTPYSPSKDRKAFIKALNDALDQVNNGRTKVPNRMWSGSNDVIEFRPKFKGKPLAIMGETTFYIKEADFAKAIKTIVASVDAGELDEALEGGSGESTAPTGAAQPKKERKTTPQGSLNIRVGGYRRGKMSDADIRKKLADEGVDQEMIEKALAPKAKK